MSKYMTHDEVIKQLERKKRIAEMKLEERKLKWEIFKTYIPIKFQIKYSKCVVIFCILAVMCYSIAAISLQRNTLIEISPTLTTCIFSFFGVELLGLVGIKMTDTKFNINQNDTNSDAEG